MFRILLAVSALALVSACGDEGNPFSDDPAVDDGSGGGGGDDGGGDGGGGDGGGGGIDAGGLPPGTEEPSVDEGIYRYEARDGQGGGLVTSVSYNEDDDTFTVDNLAFDGENVYTRSAAVPTLGGYAIYEAALQSEDSLTGDPISQIVPYRALFGVSQNKVSTDEGEVPRTSFAIVRTGGYVDYGFGGFVYEREGGVVLPDGGQATFSGDYAGIRIFQERGGLEYTRGNMVIDIDFNDFNANSGVKGRITGREAFDVDGTPIPVGDGDGELPLPDVYFVVEEGAGTGVDENGEMTGQLFSIQDGEEYETGTYYAIIAGDMTDADDGGEIVGVLVMESTDPRFDVTAQETGGFILYR